MLENPEDAKPPAGAADTTELQPGTNVGGYVVDGKIGEGGMGVVYGARHPRIGKRVAIKVLAPAYTGDPSTVERFEQEARFVNEIRHPNIVDVFQFGELPDHRCYFVMEWLDGEALTARIDKGPLPASEMIEILDVVCDALDAAHEKGVVHRDLKSDNIFLVATRGKRTVKLLDFGLAKLASRGADMASITKTKTGILVGTPAYMSPEQARAKPVDGRSDIYALGVLGYKMLTGVLPFRGDNPLDIIFQHLNAPVPAPHKLAPKTPGELSRLIVRMMAKNPDERPSLADIRKLFAELREQAPSKAEPPTRRRATTILIGASLFLAGVITLGVVSLFKHDDPPAANAATPQPAPVTAPTPPPPAAVAAPPTLAPLPAQPMIEFEPDPVGNAAGAGSGSATPKVKRPTTPKPAEEEPPVDQTVPANKPGAVFLFLERASTIEIDGASVAQGSKGGRFEVKPGHHEIRIKAPDRQPVTRSIEVEAGGTAIVRISDDQGGGEPEPSAEPPAP